MDAATGASIEEAAHRRVRDRDEVMGAILLASGGKYNVVIANLPGARALAGELSTAGARAGVDRVLAEGESGRADLRVRHR